MRFLAPFTTIRNKANVSYSLLRGVYKYSRIRSDDDSNALGPNNGNENDLKLR